jgi:putative hemolysin
MRISALESASIVPDSNTTQSSFPAKPDAEVSGEESGDFEEGRCSRGRANEKGRQGEHCKSRPAAASAYGTCYQAGGRARAEKETQGGEAGDLDLS